MVLSYSQYCCLESYGVIIQPVLLFRKHIVISQPVLLFTRPHRYFTASAAVYKTTSLFHSQCCCLQDHIVISQPVLLFTRPHRYFTASAAVYKSTSLFHSQCCCLESMVLSQPVLLFRKLWCYYAAVYKIKVLMSCWDTLLFIQIKVLLCS